eukprot:scaffold2868_cov171-Amphora_coffeaeformis.AAC.21
MSRTTTNSTMTKRSQQVKYKKAPGAPKRFKSAYMFFSEQQHKIIRQRLSNKKTRAAEVAKLVSQAWKDLSDEGRSKWLELGRLDRERYERQKAAYKGPWKIPDVKHPNAPKRPCSAFLAFSNERRKIIVEENPQLDGTQISSALSKMWKESSEKVKQTYREREARERGIYKKQRAAWDHQKDLALSEAATIVEESCSDFSESNSDDTMSKSDTLQESTSTEHEMLSEEADMSDMMAFHDIVFGKDKSWKGQEVDRVNTFGSFISFTSANRRASNYELFPNATWSTPDVPRKINLPARKSLVDIDILSMGRCAEFSPAAKLIPNETQSIAVAARKAQFPAKQASRFENYSMDDILEDDELFEDFLPSQVQNASSTF